MTNFPYAALAARFADPADRDRFAAVVMGTRTDNPIRAFEIVARRSQRRRPSI